MNRLEWEPAQSAHVPKILQLNSFLNCSSTELPSKIVIHILLSDTNFVLDRTSTSNCKYPILATEHMIIYIIERVNVRSRYYAAENKLEF